MCYPTLLYRVHWQKKEVVMPNKTKRVKKKYQVFMLGSHEQKAVLNGILWAYSAEQAVFLWSRKSGAESCSSVYDRLIAREIK